MQHLIEGRDKKGLLPLGRPFSLPIVSVGVAGLYAWAHEHSIPLGSRLRLRLLLCCSKSPSKSHDMARAYVSVALLVSLTAPANAAQRVKEVAALEKQAAALDAERAVRACGFKHAKAASFYGGGYAIELGPKERASMKQLACALRVERASGYAVTTTILPSTWSAQFEKAYSSAWLESRVLLSKLPPYRPKRTNNLKYARALEILCGHKARSAFTRGKGGKIEWSGQQRPSSIPRRKNAFVMPLSLPV